MIEDIIKECLSCPNPLCEKGCPVGNKIRDFIKALKEDDLNEAQDILYRENPYPQITCRVCAYEKQCEGHCVKHFKGQPVLVHEIEKYISDNSEYKYQIKESNGRKIAIIGAGIASLSLAKLLLIDGYSVDIYEREKFIGGAIETGIPPFRFDHSFLKNIYDELIEFKANFYFNTVIPKDIDIKDLLKRYDRVVIATGARKENKMNIEGEEYSLSGLKVLYDLNVLNRHKDYAYGKALVVGGGNVAIDVARSLKRIVKDVTIIYRRSEKEMPANLSEITEAKKDGIVLNTLSNPTKIVKNSDGSLEVSLVKMELGEKDASGRASVTVKEDSEYTVSTDLIVMAIGQKYLPLYEDMKIDNHITSYDRVYAVGDANIGPSTVSHCIGDAKKLKELIDSSF